MSHRRLLVGFVVGLAVALGVRTSANAAAAPKVVVKCQATLEKSGAKFVAKKLGALAKCTDGVFKCLQTVDETADAGAKRTACITKSRQGCLKSLAAITAARQAFVAAVTGSCATLDAAQVTGADGLGYAAADCSAFGGPVTDVTSLAACLAAQHDCLGSRLFQRTVPRTLELLQFTPPSAVVPPAADLASLACLDDHGGTGTDIDDLVLGKAIVKCQTAIEKVAFKLAGARAKGLAKCVDALFVCNATKTGDDLQTCRAKARAGCDKTFTALAAQGTALGDSLEKPCGDATLFAALLTPAGANFSALLPPTLTRAFALPAVCNVLRTRADLYACVHAIILEVLEELHLLEAPKTAGLLGDVGCGLESCGTAPTPKPTSTPGGGGGGKITQIIDANGDGMAGHHLGYPRFVATDGNGTAYVSGYASNNAFRIDPDGTITLIMQNTPQAPYLNAFQIAVDGNTVYLVADGVANVYKIVGNGAPTRLIEATGDGVHDLSYAGAIAVDLNHNVYVGGNFSNNVFKITPTGTITQIIDATGDGTHALTWPGAITTDDAGNVYVAARSSNNAFKITPNGTITQIVGPTGDGLQGHTLNLPFGIAVQHDTGTAYVTGFTSSNIFRILADGTVTQFVGPSGDGQGNAFSHPYFIATDAAGNVYAPSAGTQRVFKITPGGAMTVILDATGDGTHVLSTPGGIAADAVGNVWVTGGDTYNVFKVPAGAHP